MLDPFQPGPNFGKFPVTADGMGFTGTAGGFTMGRPGKGSLNGGAQVMGSFNRFDSEGMGASFGTPYLVFPDPAFPAVSLKSDLVIASKGTFGPNSAVLPSFNQLMRGSSNLPRSSSFGNLKLSYQDTLRPLGNLGNPALPSGSALFTSSDLGNGVFLSAGTGYGSHSIAGAPAASVGASNGPKRSGTAVNLKLSF
jgi:hypothetical protein